MLFAEEGEVVEVEAEEDVVLKGVGVLVVVAFVFGLDIVEVVAEINRGAVEYIAEGHSGKTSDAYTALVDVFVPHGTHVGCASSPDVEDTIGMAVYTDAVFLHFGVVEVEAEVEFEVEVARKGDAFGYGEVDEHTFFDSVDIASHILVRAEDAGTVVAGELELSCCSHLTIVEMEKPAPAALVVVAYTHPELVGEFVVHAAVFGNIEGFVGGYGAGRDELCRHKFVPDLGTVLLTSEDAHDSVVVTGTAAVEVGLFGIGHKKACVDGDREACDTFFVLGRFLFLRLCWHGEECEDKYQKG